MKAGILTNQLYSWKNYNELSIGGGERVTWRLARLLLEKDCEVHIYQYSPVKFTKFIGGIFIHGVSKARMSAEGYIDGLCDYFYEKTIDFDVVILNLPDVVGKKVREDAILITHGIMFFGKDLSELSESDVERLLGIFESVGTNVVVHQMTIDAVRTLGFDRIADDMICIDNYVDTGVFVPKKKMPIVLFPGRAEKAKGVEFIPGILEDLKDTGWKIVWAGGGSLFNVLKSLEGEYPNFSAINVPMEEVHNAFAHSSICVVFNLSSKGNSLTLMEGMSSGCACIGIEGGTTLIEHGINGVLCSPDDISENIKMLIANEELRNGLGARARKDVICRHGANEWKGKWIDVIFGDKQWT